MLLACSSIVTVRHLRSKQLYLRDIISVQTITPRSRNKDYVGQAVVLQESSVILNHLEGHCIPWRHGKPPLQALPIDRQSRSASLHVCFVNSGKSNAIANFPVIIV